MTTTQNNLTQHRHIMLHRGKKSKVWSVGGCRRKKGRVRSLRSKVGGWQRGNSMAWESSTPTPYRSSLPVVVRDGSQEEKDPRLCRRGWFHCCGYWEFGYSGVPSHWFEGRACGTQCRNPKESLPQTVSAACFHLCHFISITIVMAMNFSPESNLSEFGFLRATDQCGK